jgi:hypothetical protein
MWHWDGRQWLYWDGQRWLYWDGQKWWCWDGRQWAVFQPGVQPAESKAPAPPKGSDGRPKCYPSKSGEANFGPEDRTCQRCQWSAACRELGGIGGPPAPPEDLEGQDPESLERLLRGS